MAIPNYVMQTTLLPVKVCDAMDSMVCKFLWGDADDKKKLHLRAWDVLCKPKCSTGLGYRRFRDVNAALVTKLGWIVCTELNRP